MKIPVYSCHLFFVASMLLSGAPLLAMEITAVSQLPTSSGQSKETCVPAEPKIQQLIILTNNAVAQKEADGLEQVIKAIEEASGRYEVVGDPLFFTKNIEKIRQHKQSLEEKNRSLPRQPPCFKPLNWHKLQPHIVKSRSAIQTNK